MQIHWSTGQTGYINTKHEVINHFISFQLRSLCFEYSKINMLIMTIGDMYGLFRGLRGRAFHLT